MGEKDNNIANAGGPKMSVDIVPVKEEAELAPTPMPFDWLATLEEFFQYDVAEGAPSDDTKRMYRRAAAYFLTWCAQNGIDAAAATPDDIRRYRQAMREAGMADSTVAGYLSAVRRLYTAAVWRGIRRDNPAAGVRVTIRGREEKIRYTTEQGLQALLAAVKGNDITAWRDRAILALAAIHGVRQIELHRLNKQDIQYRGDSPIAILQGKRGPRVIFLRPDVMATIQRYLSFRTDREEALFIALPPGRPPGGRMARRSINYLLRRYLDRAGLTDITPHGLRHTVATLALSGGARLEEVQDMLGHKSLDTTRVYARIVEAAKNNPAFRINVNILGNNDTNTNPSS